MQIPKRKSEEDRRKLAAPRDNFVTQKKLDSWKKTVEHLKNVEHRPAAEEVARTQAMGDLSENAAYQDAKWRLRRINNRITSLQDRIKYAVVIDSTPNYDGSIKIGSTVILRLADRQLEYIILGTAESDPLEGRISHSSPLGSKLLDHYAGDTVMIKTGDRELEYQIVEVR